MVFYLPVELYFSFPFFSASLTLGDASLLLDNFHLFTCVFVTIIGDFRYELLFYPRYHLDQSSLLCRKPLLTNPMVMDVYQDYLLVTYRPFDVHVYHVKVTGELSPSSSPDLQVI